MIRYSDNPKEYKRQYYLLNRDNWAKKYWGNAQKRKKYIKDSMKSFGKIKYSYDKKHSDWGNKPEGYYSKIRKQWQKDNPENTKRTNKVCRQRRKAVIKMGGPLSTKTIQSVYEENILLFGTLTCIYCMNPIKFGKDTLEHCVPLSRGGTNNKENLHITCFNCNSFKNKRLYEEVIINCLPYGSDSREK